MQLFKLKQEKQVPIVFDDDRESDDEGCGEAGKRKEASVRAVPFLGVSREAQKHRRAEQDREREKIEEIAHIDSRLTEVGEGKKERDRHAEREDERAGVVTVAK